MSAFVRKSVTGSVLLFQITPTTDDLLVFVKRTLCDVQSKLLNVDMVEITKNALQQLVEAGLVRQKTADGKTMSRSCRDLTLSLSLEVTNLGRAVFKGLFQKYSYVSMCVNYSRTVHTKTINLCFEVKHLINLALEGSTEFF